MEPQTEQKLMQAMYDRIYDMLTYSPGGIAPIYNAQTTLLQMQQPGQALNPDDFTNAVSPTHPAGSLLASENFSRLVDPVPAVAATYAPTSVGVENTYGEIITSASVANPGGGSAHIENTAITSQGNRAFAQALQIKPMSGAPATVALPSAAQYAFDQARMVYDKALTDYTTALKSMDMTRPVEQQKWQAIAPPLQARLDMAYQNWRTAGGTVDNPANQVAVSAAAGVPAPPTATGSGIASVIANDQRLFAQTQLAGQYPGDTPWHLSYGMPTNWCDPTPAAISQIFTHYEQSTDKLNVSNKSRFTSLGGSTVFAKGLFTVDVQRQGLKLMNFNQMHMQATNISLSMDFCLVRIMRPWLNGLLFSLGGWRIDGFPQGTISTGNLTDGKETAMKIMPVAFVVARNLKITGNFTTQDLNLVNSRLKAGSIVGLGPFQIGGAFYHPVKKPGAALTFQGEAVGQHISVPGLQIIAWICQVIPLCPPLG